MASGLTRDYARIALDYARRAVADKKGKKHCKWVRLAAKRHLDDLKKAAARKRPDYYFDEWHANDVCDFIEKLPHVKGQWSSPTIKLEPWQVFILAVVFGWRRTKGGARRFRSVYVEVARKNAKSTLAAGVALYCLCCDDEPGPEILIGATTGEQAWKVFEPAKLMVERTEDLREAFELEAMARSIPCYSNGGYIKPINAKGSTQDGWNAHCSILDELHAHPKRDLFDVMDNARGSRKNGLLWVITTAGYDVTGVCYEQRTLVTKILQGLITADNYFGIIYTLDKGDDELDPKVWIKSNPNMGVSIEVSDLEAQAVKARASPASMGDFKTKRLNVWTSAKDGHVNIVKWQASAREPVILDELEGQPCWGGLDLAATSDMNAFVLVWDVDGRLKVHARFWLPEETVQPRTERGNVPYQTWVEQGLITVTPGNVADYAFIEKDIAEALDRFKVQSIAYDQWNASDLVNRLVEKGAPMVRFVQGIPSFNGPMKEVDRRYMSGLIDHGNNAVLTWHASNVVTRTNHNEDIAPDRKNSQEKIDGYVALLMAVGRMMAEQDGPSVYEERGILVI